MRKRVESDPPKSTGKQEWLSEDLEGAKQDLLCKHLDGIRERLLLPNGEGTLLSCLGTDFPLSLPLWTQYLQELKVKHSLTTGLAFALSLAKEMHASRVFTASLEPLGVVLHVFMELVGRVEAFPNCVRSLEGKECEVKEALFLIEICFERLQEVPEVASALGTVGEQVLFRMKSFLPMLIAAGNPAFEELFMRMAMTLANCTARAFLSRNEHFPRLFEAFKELIKQLSSLYESLFDRIVPELTHNYWTCRPKCSLCTGNSVSFRYAVAACLTGHSDTRVGDIMDYAAALVLEGLRTAGLGTGLYLDYIGLYVNIEKPERKPSGLTIIPSRLLSLCFSLSDTSTREDLFPKLPSAPALIAHLFTQLSSALDSPACLPALISLVTDTQSSDQQLFSYIHLKGLVLANAGSKALANRVGLGELVLEKCEWVQPVREMIGQLVLTPATLAGFIQRINRAVRVVPIDIDTANSLITVFITIINAGETFALRAIKSLGGLHIFLPALEVIGTGEHCNALRIGVLRVMEAGMELMNDEFVEMLSLALEESGQRFEFDEETVILLLGFFSDYQSKYPDSYLSADFLLFTPNLWQALSHPLYHSLIFPIQLSCFAHAIANGLDTQVRHYGCVLLTEINRRNYRELSRSQSEIVSLLESYLNHMRSPSRVCDLLYLGLKALPDNPQFAISICPIVQKHLTKPLFTEQKDHHELVAILKAFKPWLELDKGSCRNELGPLLVQILISSTIQSSRVTLLSLTSKFSVQTGFDDEQLSVLRDLAVVIDEKTYKDLCLVWPYKDTKSPKWLKRAVLLADLVPRSRSSCLCMIWDDFMQKLLSSGEAGKLEGAEGYSYRWLVEVFDRLVELETPSGLDYKELYWERVVKLLLTTDNYSTIGKFVKAFWQPEKPLQLFRGAAHPQKASGEMQRGSGVDKTPIEAAILLEVVKIVLFEEKVGLILRNGTLKLVPKSSRTKEETVQLAPDFVANPKLIAVLQPYLIYPSRSSLSAYNLLSGQQLPLPPHHSLPLTTLYSAAPYLLQASEDCLLSLWSCTYTPGNRTTPAKDSIELVRVYYGHRASVMDVYMDRKTGVVISVDKLGVVLIHSWEDGVVLAAIEREWGEGMRVTGSKDRLVAVYFLQEGAVELYTFAGLPLRTHQLSYSDRFESITFTKSGEQLLLLGTTIKAWDPYSKRNTPARFLNEAWDVKAAEYSGVLDCLAVILLSPSNSLVLLDCPYPSPSFLSHLPHSL